MAEFIDPVPCFHDLVDVFEEGSRTTGGIRLDEDLCRMMAEVMTEAAEGVAALVDYARSQGLVAPIAAAERPRTPVERRHLARLAVASDPEARVVAFPGPAIRRAVVTDGGAAA